MKHYFYSNGEKQFGPVTFNELKQVDITPETLIWFEGLENWTPAKYILELEEILQISPPPVNLTAPKLESISSRLEPVSFDRTHSQRIEKSINEKKWEIESINNIHPWRRFFARTVDLLTSGLLVFLLFSYFIGRTFPGNVDSFVKLLDNPLFTSVLLYLVWIPVEAFYLFLIGTTPAKWLFGIQIKGKGGENLSFIQSLSRSFQVFISGEGFAIPIITLFSRISCYRSLR